MNTRNSALFIICLVTFLSCRENKTGNKIFDVHLHGDQAPEKQLRNLVANGVYTIVEPTSPIQALSFGFCKL